MAHEMETGKCSGNGSPFQFETKPSQAGSLTRLLDNGQLLLLKHVEIPSENTRVRIHQIVPRPKKLDACLFCFACSAHAVNRKNNHNNYEIGRAHV